uniref:Mi n=1 Tax=Schizosaccharomyces japonicus TaxID=4897 RepID=I6T567_SCHJP|nr:Mi [Schizosaccharomyces japonicus]
MDFEEKIYTLALCIQTVLSSKVTHRKSKKTKSKKNNSQTQLPSKTSTLRSSG